MFRRPKTFQGRIANPPRASTRSNALVLAGLIVALMILVIGLAIKTAAELLCVEGRYFESQGEYAKALENYLIVLTVGRDFSSPDNTLISHLISWYFNQMSLRKIEQLVAGREVERVVLDRALERLEQIEQTQGPITEAFRGEAQCGT